MSRAELISDLIANTFVQAQQSTQLSTDGLLNDCLSQTDVDNFASLFSSPAFQVVVRQKQEDELAHSFTIHGAEFQQMSTLESVVEWCVTGKHTRYTWEQLVDMHTNSMEVVDKFAKKIDAENTRLITDGHLAVEGLIDYVGVLSSCNQWRLRAAWVDLESSIFKANMAHLKELFDTIAEGMKTLRGADVVKLEHMDEWDVEFKEFEQKMDSHAQELGYQNFAKLHQLTATKSQEARDKFERLLLASDPARLQEQLGSVLGTSGVKYAIECAVGGSAGSCVIAGIATVMSGLYAGYRHVHAQGEKHSATVKDLHVGALENILTVCESLRKHVSALTQIRKKAHEALVPEGL
jgi:hypothetical protein